MNKYLQQTLSWVRPAYSQSESTFVQWLQQQIKDLGYVPHQDHYGNVWVMQGCDTLFTAHTDTVHRTTRDGTHVQQVIKRNPDDTICLPSNAQTGAVLGADDGAGVALMLSMLKHGVYGDYVFFRDEEIGGLGSSWAAQHMADHLKTYKRAIAFDRKGTTSVITHQAGGRCCSDNFARCLAAKLNRIQPEFWFETDSGGIFTDTANLTQLIPECTNISVGYQHAHTSNETLDYAFWEKLVKACCKVDWCDLPTVRNPLEKSQPYDFYDDYADCGAELDLDALAQYIGQYGYDAIYDIMDNFGENVIADLLFHAYGK